jgi:hypothetical protein
MALTMERTDESMTCGSLCEASPFHFELPRHGILIGGEENLAGGGLEIDAAILLPEFEIIRL